MATFGVEILMMLDAAERNEQWVLDFRTQLAATHPQFLKDLFPDPNAAYEAGRTKDGEYDIDRIDAAELEWSVPDSPAEKEDLDRWIRDHMQGTVSAADLSTDEDGGGWQ